MMKLFIYLYFAIPLCLFSSVRISEPTLKGHGDLLNTTHGFTVHNKKVDSTHMGTVLKMTVELDVSKGKNAALNFKLKSLGKDQAGRCRIMLRGNAKNILKKVIYCDKKSRQYTLPIRFNQSSKKLELVIGVSKFIQRLEFTDLKISQQKKEPFTLVNHLTEEMWDYQGREADAKWRLEAQKRIKKFRKGNVNLRIKSQKYSPNDLRIEYEMQRHAFPFGTAVRMDVLAQENADSAKYKEEMYKLFNSVVPGRAMKWKMWDRFDRQQVSSQIRDLKKSGMEIRGHNHYLGWLETPARFTQKIAEQ